MILQAYCCGSSLNRSDGLVYRHCSGTLRTAVKQVSQSGIATSPPTSVFRSMMISKFAEVMKREPILNPFFVPVCKHTFKVVKLGILICNCHFKPFEAGPKSE